MSNQGWENILDPGENVIWQGRPDRKIVWKISHAFTFLFGLVFAAFALFWMVMASSAGGVFWMFGLLHFSVGIGLALLPPFWGAWRRRHTWYTLTDRRAFIATDKPFVGRQLKSYPIERDTNIVYTPGSPATVHFSQEYHRTDNGSRKIGIGFERIGEGEKVYRLIRDVQRGSE